jgi:quercetin dioxygenase-like cupin family protein
MTVKAYVVQRNEGDHLEMLGTDIRILAGRRTGASFSVMTAYLPVGIGPPPHVHDDEDEAFYVLEGRMRFKTEGAEWVVDPGGFVYLPRGLTHQPMVEGDHAARALTIMSRVGLEDFFSDFIEDLAKSGGPPSLEMLDEVGAAYQLRHFSPGTI